MKTQIMQTETAHDQSTDGPVPRPGESSVHSDQTTGSRTVDAATVGSGPRTAAHPSTPGTGG